MHARTVSGSSCKETGLSRSGGSTLSREDTLLDLASIHMQLTRAQQLPGTALSGGVSHPRISPSS